MRKILRDLLKRTRETPVMGDLDQQITTAIQRNQLLRFEAAQVIVQRTSIEGSLDESDEASLEALRAARELAATQLEAALLAITANSSQLQDECTAHLQELNEVEQAQLTEKLKRAVEVMDAPIESNVIFP